MAVFLIIITFNVERIQLPLTIGVKSPPPFPKQVLLSGS